MVMDFYLRHFLEDDSFPFFIQYGKHEKQMNLHRHHDYTELVCVLKGSALHQVDKDVYPISKGDVFVIAPGGIHGYLNARDFEICNIMFRQSLLEDLGAELRTMPGYQSLFLMDPYCARHFRFQARLCLDAAKQLGAEDLLHRMVGEFVRREPGWCPMIRGNFLQLVVNLSRWYQDLSRSGDADSLQVARALAFMETNYHRNITLKDIADTACLSPRHFSRLFRQSQGASPHRYLLNLRMRRACELLDLGTLPVSEVSGLCGFQDSGHFARQFTHIMGLGPSAYRCRT